MSPQQAIDKATADGFCHIGQHSFLMKTCEAAASIKLEGIKAPFVLVIEHNWSDLTSVKTAKNRALIKACEKRA
jgi:hypothetical protein